MRGTAVQASDPWPLPLFFYPFTQPLFVDKVSLLKGCLAFGDLGDQRFKLIQVEHGTTAVPLAFNRKYLAQDLFLRKREALPDKRDVLKVLQPGQVICKRQLRSRDFSGCRKMKNQVRRYLDALKNRKPGQVRIGFQGRNFNGIQARNPSVDGGRNCRKSLVIQDDFSIIEWLKAIVQVKLLPDADQSERLLETMRTFNAACGWLAERAVELNAFTHFKLQKACYKSIRTLFGLSAQTACLVCAKVADAYAIGKMPRKFRPDGAIIYDVRLLSWKLAKSLVSIWALPKRLSIPFICGEKQRELLSYPRGQSDLIYRDGSFFLHVTVDLPDTEEKAVMDLIGVDLGIANIAFDSDGNRYGGGHVNKARHRNKALRKKLQKKGTKSAKRLIRRRGQKERRFATDVNHQISKRIVTLAERTGRGLAIEELDGIRERARAKKDQRYRLHSWAFGQLGGFIAYKAKRAGVPVVFVDPKHTSQRCNRCGHTERGNRRSQAQFECRSCGHAAHADQNGALNIRLRGLEILCPADVIPPYAEAISHAN